MRETDTSEMVQDLTDQQLEQLIRECSAVETLVLARDYGFRMSSFTMRGDAAEKIEQWRSLATVGESQCSDRNRFKVIWVEF
jgi:hypothetical protein